MTSFILAGEFAVNEISDSTRCGGCQGNGSVPCQLCLTRGRLKCYIQLTVSWRTHSDEQVVEGTTLPDDLVRSAKGFLAVEDQQPRVSRA